MASYSKTKNQTENIAVGAILTALVVVLQFLAIYTRPLFPMFSITLVLIPIVIGAAICGTKVAAWLGFVFGVVVLLSGDAAAFLAFSVPGTIITVLLKGTMCGLVTGFVYSALAKRGSKLAIWVSALVCPIVNSGIFALGCYVFFLEDIATKWAGGADVTAYIFLTLIGINFIVEVLINVILNPTITTVIRVIKNRK